MTTVKEKANQLNQKAVVTLFVIDASKYGLGQLRFTAEKDKNGEEIVMNGNTYMCIPIEADGFEITNQGTMPTPTLRFFIDDVNIRSILLSSKDLLGCPVARIRMFEENLDSGSDPDAQARLNDDIYYIEQKTKQTNYEIEFELKTLMDIQGRKIPRNVTNKNTCMQTYRSYDTETDQFVYNNVTCPYAGINYFNEFGQTTFDPTEDVCGKKLSDCEKRFGTNSELPFKAFPGLRNY